jgi:ppGpp synthetase/RelA/SpoT-type nucleotidyltranferase
MSEHFGLPPLAYNKLIVPHERALKRLELNFGFFIDDIGQIDLFSVAGRTKTYQSALRKSAELGVPVQNLDDLAGLRIVVGTSSEVPIIERFFTRQQYGNDLEIIKHQKILRQNGYRAIHLVLEFKGSYQTSVYPGRVEVQIHTIFEHAFNFLSRSWTYKQAWEFPPTWSSKFSQISKLLEDIDHAASELHIDVMQNSTDLASAKLSPHSVQMLIRSEFNEEVSISDCVDTCRMFRDRGYETNGQLRNFFQSKQISELYQLALDGKSNSFSNMDKNAFWLSFGTRGDSAEIRKLILKLRDI